MLRTLWLLTRLRLLRLLNLLGLLGQLSWRRKRRADETLPRRTGTARKSPTGPVLGSLMLALMLFGFGSLAANALHNLHQAVEVEPHVQTPATSDTGGVSQVGDKYRWSVEEGMTLPPGEPPLPAAFVRGVFSGPLLSATAGLMSLLLLTAWLNELGARELAKPEWDMEWLVTLPVRLPTLLWARLAERTFGSPFAMIGLVPLGTVLAWKSGHPWWLAPVAGLLGALPLCLLSALARTLVDTGLRLRLAPSKLRNLQAGTSVLGLLCTYLALSVCTQVGSRFGIAAVTALPDWTLWLPPGLTVQALNAQQPLQALSLLALCLAEVLALTLLGIAWMQAQLSQGLLATGAREATGRAARPGSMASSGLQRFLRAPLQRRELLLLARDRNFLIQTLVLPVLVVGGQIVMNGNIAALAGLWSAPPALIASAAFGVASYMLMLSAFQTINAEGAALWLLYTFPRRIDAMLREKALLWAGLALVYPLAIILPAFVAAGGLDASLAGHALLALAGVPIYATLAVALAVFASDPFADERAARLRPRYVYLFMLLSGFYVYGIWAARWWQSLEIALLAALLAFALWQKASDHLPFLLDPSAAPPPRASAADGMIAAMSFLIAQLAIGALWLALKPAMVGAALLGSFVAAGALTYGLVRLTYWRTRTQGLPRFFGPGFSLVASLRIGLAFGGLAAALGVAYLLALQAFGQLPASGDAGPALRGALIALAVIAAPLFEEFIFRGLLFAGVRRSMRLLPAAAFSAAVFAIVHPPVSIIPVFFLGLCTALAHERSRSLAAPMLAHSLYNAVVIGMEAWLRQA